MRRGRRAPPAPEPPSGPATCALCKRPLGHRVEQHHPLPKSRGGRDTVPVHPICHRTIHATLTNRELAVFNGDMVPLRAEPRLARFIAWIADKPFDFHAPTRRGAGG